MIIRWLTAFVILPFNVLLVIPGLLLRLFAGGPWTHDWASPASPVGLLAMALASAGLTLAAWTVVLFVRYGDGTAAPWDPPKNFVVRGPYRFVRNPMLLSVLLLQAAEATFARSWPLCGWLAVFMTANLLYIPLVEEPGLAARFGADYLRYKASVPRWIPRPTAYR